MGYILLALGLVCLFEGLVLALIPGRMEELLEWLASVPLEARRTIGLLALTSGAILIYLASLIGI